MTGLSDKKLIEYKIFCDDTGVLHIEGYEVDDTALDNYKVLYDSVKQQLILRRGILNFIGKAKPLCSYADSFALIIHDVLFYTKEKYLRLVETEEEGVYSVCIDLFSAAPPSRLDSISRYGYLSVADLINTTGRTEFEEFSIKGEVFDESSPFFSYGTLTFESVFDWSTVIAGMIGCMPYILKYPKNIGDIKMDLLSPTPSLDVQMFRPVPPDRIEIVTEIYDDKSYETENLQQLLKRL